MQARRTSDSGLRNYLRRVPPNCVLYYPSLVGGGTIINDYSGSANNGTISGATWTRLSSGLWTLSFDGADDYVTPDPGSSLTDVNTFTWSCWVNPDNLTSSHYPLAKRHFKHLRIDATTGKLRGTVSSAGAATTVTTETVTAGKWHRVDMKYDNSGDRKIYFDLDGVAATYDQQTAATGTITAESGVDGYFIIGAYSTTEVPFPGDIALIVFKNAVQTTTESQYRFLSERSLFGV